MIDWDTPAAPDALPKWEGPTPGFGELVEAARINFDAGSLTTAQEVSRAFYGKQIVAALAAKGITRWRDPDSKRERLFDASQFGPRISGGYFSPAQKAAWDAIARIRQSDPAFMTGLTSEAELDAAATAKRKRDYASSSETLARGGTLASLGASLVGGATQSLTDPQQIFAMAATAPLGGSFGVSALRPVAARLFGGTAASSTAMTVAMRAIGGGAVNVAAAAPIIPTTIERRAEIGEDMDAGDIALELGINFVLGAGLELGQVAGGAALRGAASAVEAMSARAQARALRRIAEERPLSPDEADALAVLDEVVRDVGSSPFVPTPAGDAAHAARLTEAVDALESDRPIDDAVFADPAPVRDETAAKARRDAVATLAADRRSGSLDAQRIADALNMDVADVKTAMMEIASGRYGDRAIVMRRRYLPPDPYAPEGPRSFETYFARAPQRQGPVDLLTTLADSGGVESKKLLKWNSAKRRNDLVLGQRFIPGAGPLFRKTGAPLDEIGERLWEEGWFPNRPLKSNGETTRPIEAEVIDLISRAMNGERIYHPDDWAKVQAADEARARAGGEDEQAAAYAQFDDDMRAWWDSPEGQFFADGELTPDMLAEMRPFIGDRSTPLDVWDAWMDSRAATRAAEAEVAYAEADTGSETPYGGADYVDGFDPPPAREDAAGPGPQDGGGPDPVSGNAGQGAGGYSAPGETLADAANRAAAADALARFDDPAGDGVAAQVESLVHDLRAEVEAETGAQAGEAGAGARDGGAVAADSPNAADAPSGAENGLEPLPAEYQAKVDRAPPEKRAEVEAYWRDFLKAEAAETAQNLAWLQANVPDDLRPFVEQVGTYGVTINLGDGAFTWDVVNQQRQNPKWTRGGRHPFTLKFTIADARRLAAAAQRPAGPSPLDLGAAVDPAIAERQRQELALRAAAPKRGPVTQEDMASTSLFGQVDAFLTHDGRPTTKADLLAEIEADDAALQAMRDCL